jgi:asparagine synthase (glutamine-hydrolysing)
MAFTLKNTLEKYIWVNDENTHVTGFTWLNGVYTSGASFLKVIREVSTAFETFKNFAMQLNGQFAIVVLKESEKWAVCSHTWSFPLFYTHYNNNNFFSDDPQNLLTGESEKKSQAFPALYFLAFGVTPGNSTLKNKIFQVQPGEILRLGQNKTESFSIFPNEGQNSSTVSGKVGDAELQHHLLDVFEKQYSYLKDKQVLLPLTRGYDSRLIGCLLKEFGHRDVICATWGRAQNNEVETARKVASQLGYKHIFIDYSQEVPDNFVHTHEFEDYVNYSGHFSSMPFLQDYFAIQALKNKKIIDHKTIALPGHPGDFLRGSHLDSKMTTNNTGYLISKIMSAFGSSFPFRSSEKKQIRKFLLETFFATQPAGEMWKNYEQWDYSERQCKFIGNSSGVYSFFGLDFFMPLFDLDLILFFSHVPFKQKLGAVLYNRTLENYFFKTHKVDFDLKLPATDGRIFNPLKNNLIKIAPQTLKKWHYPMKDPIFYHEITRILKGSDKSFNFKPPLKPNSYNSYIIQWYLQHIENKFSVGEN